NKVPNTYRRLTISLFAGVLSQAQVTQSGPVSVAIAGTTIINCALQGVEFISSTNPSWYHHKEDQPPKLLFYKSRERASGIPDRLSADTYGSHAKLTISNVEVGDEGDYYCAMWHNDGLHTVPLLGCSQLGFYKVNGRDSCKNLLAGFTCVVN
uniref:Ig-like domain-containing protein n=1 Tax=Pseudonaja textilis TaxID=8673 RepID=A0A670ZVN0_PSETE